MTTFTFESSDEGFTLTGDGTLQDTFWTTPSGGMNDCYTFELDSDGYDIVQSINAYGTAAIQYNLIRKPYHRRFHVERRMLKQVDTTDEIYNVKRFKGEIRS